MADNFSSNSKQKEAEAYSNGSGLASGPSAPPVDGDDDLPPPYDFSSPPPSTVNFAYPEPTKTVYELPVTRTTEEQVRTALKQFADKKMFFTEKRLAETVIKEIADVNVFYYKLDTMYEKRATVDAAVPWYGEQLDGPFNGPPPGPWDIPLFPAEPFKNAELRMEVPHTAYTQPCFKCTGMGRTTCTMCHGFGTRGMGKDRKRCFTCTGSGKVVCHTCKGQCQLKRYVELVAIYTCRTLESLDNSTELSEKKVKKADGHLVVDHRAQRVNKLPDFPSTVISETCSQLIDISLSQFPAERVIEQRQTVKLVPVANVVYGHGKKGGAFRLYGLERRIDFPNYPSSCSIL
ncbi:Protein SSUH2 -like protein [Halotydeus destructor]|nr:Protein SSUH2 -like protein [Halotydeus destructor]